MLLLPIGFLRKLMMSFLVSSKFLLPRENSKAPREWGHAKCIMLLPVGDHRNPNVSQPLNGGEEASLLLVFSLWEKLKAAVAKFEWVHLSSCRRPAFSPSALAQSLRILSVPQPPFPSRLSKGVEVKFYSVKNRFFEKGGVYQSHWSGKRSPNYRSFVFLLVPTAR